METAWHGCAPAMIDWDGRQSYRAITRNVTAADPRPAVARMGAAAQEWAFVDFQRSLEFFDPREEKASFAMTVLVRPWTIREAGGRNAVCERLLGLARAAMAELRACGWIPDEAPQAVVADYGHMDLRGGREFRLTFAVRLPSAQVTVAA